MPDPVRKSAWLIVLAVLIFGQTLRHGFVSFDDPAYVTGNPKVNQGLSWEGIRWAFTGVHVGNWHPLTSLAHMLDVTLFGLQPEGHHGMSVLLHAINGMLMFRVLIQLTRASWPAFLAAALFIVHPLHVESVAWVSIKKDLLSTMFWWLAIGAYGRYVQRGCRKQYALALGFTALGLLSKPMVVTLPLVLCLIDVWPLQRYRDGRFPAVAARLAMEKIPFLMLALASGLLTLWAQRSDGAVRSLAAVSVEGRIENALHSYVLYLAQTLWPVGLSPYYPHPGDSLGLGVVASCAGLLAAATAGAALSLRRWPWIAVGWAWYGITLLPVIGFITVGDQARADRYTYLPLAGIFIALAWTLDRVVPVERALSRRILTVALIVPLTVVAFLQTAKWKDDATLFSHAMAVAPDNAMAAVIVAQTHVKAGRFDEAVALLEPLAASHGDTRNLYNTLGLAYAGLGQYPRALEAYGKELAFDGENASALSNAGNAYAALGDHATAAQYYERAIAADPDYADGYANLGVLRVLAGDHAGAEPLLRRATALAPGDALNWVNLGAVQAALGQQEDAVTSCRRALALDESNERVQALKTALGL